MPVRPAIILLSFFTALTLSVTAAPQPSWIWHSPTSGNNDKGSFRKTVSIDGDLKSATIAVAADNGATVMVNGEKALSNGVWNEPSRTDLKSKLKKGENQIQIDAWNEDGPAGLLVEIKLEYTDGHKGSVVTDGSWESVAAGKTDWHAAAVVGKHGDAPWGAVLSNPGSAGGPAPGEIVTLPGFEAELLYTVPKDQQGSWVGMTFDNKGRLITCDQYGGIYRMPVTAAGIGEIEQIKTKLSGAHGVLYAFNSLYVMINEGGTPHGVHRLTDTNGDDQFDKEELLLGLAGGGEHGIHSAAVTPDGKSLFIVCGNHTDPPKVDDSHLPQRWSEDHILPRMWDANGHARGRMAPGGFILQVDPDCKKVDLFCAGFRNQFDGAFNINGDFFAYDADMEWDQGTPWYRPTRINHAVSGAEFGWRSGSGKWPSYYPDSLPATVDIGPGSPTGVCSGTGAKFPGKYQRAIFANDWTYGTMYAIHSEMRGGTYESVKEEFVSGRPLPLTDVVINPNDGAMYFMVGGRRAQSALYRVTYKGKESTTPIQPLPITPEMKLSKELAAFHTNTAPATAIDAAWPHLASSDRFLRFAARTAIEHQPADKWQARALAETSPLAVMETMIALARCGDKAVQPQLIAKLLSLPIEKLPTDQLLGVLRGIELACTRMGEPEAATAAPLVARLDGMFPHADNSVNRELAQILIFLKSPTATGKTVRLMMSSVDDEMDIASSDLLARNTGYGNTTGSMQASRPNRNQIALAFSLRNATVGWSPALLHTYFSWFPTTQKWRGGNSFAKFIDNIRQEALATASPADMKAELDAESSRKQVVDASIRPPVGPGRNWTVDDAVTAVTGQMFGRDFAAGKNLFAAAACISCHHFAGDGGSIGPDVTGSANRYSLRDLLENIIEPSKVISDLYGSEKIITKDGSALIGRPAGEENGMLMLMANPYAPEILIPVKLSDIKSREAYNVSIMPPGMINTLNSTELCDLVAYLMSGGNPNDKVYAAQAGEGKTLFDGKSLAGWSGDPALWSVQDGVIVGTTVGHPIKRNTFLVWDGGEPADFTLTYEAQCIGNNSGMQYRSSYIDPAAWALKGYQADIHPNPTYVAMLYAEGLGRGIVAERGQKVVVDAETGKPNVVGSTAPATPIDIAEWHTYTIHAKGNRLIHMVDGTVAIDLTDNHKENLKSGKIGLQLHAGPEMTARFRNIRLITE